MLWTWTSGLARSDDSSPSVLVEMGRILMGLGRGGPRMPVDASHPSIYFWLCHPGLSVLHCPLMGSGNHGNPNLGRGGSGADI